MAASNVTPIPEIVKDLIAYDPETGLLTWKVSRGTRKVGGIAGTTTKRGYIRIQVSKTLCLGHRVAWFLHYGQQPGDQLDHIDNDGTNNRIVNLREATPSQNCSNTRTRAHCKSGIKNVCWRRNAWEVHIRINGKHKQFGRFQNLFEARERAIEVRKQYHMDFANHGNR